MKLVTAPKYMSNWEAMRLAKRVGGYVEEKKGTRIVSSQLPELCWSEFRVRIPACDGAMDKEGAD